MEIRILGPIEAWHGDREVVYARRQQRLILGILALNANRQVSLDRLIELLWGAHPPQRARAVAHTRVSELRATISSLQPREGLPELTTRAGAYVLQIQPEKVDAHRFRMLVAEWHRLAPSERSGLSLRTALGLWRGQMFGGWLPEEAHASLCLGLESARLTAAEDLYEFELKNGLHHQVVDEIVELATANPSRERLMSQTMLALCRAGRGSEALDTYDRWRRWLRNELGINPSDALQQLHVAVLKGDPSLAVVGQPKTPGGTAGAAEIGMQDVSGASEGATFKPAVPHLLPPAQRDFVGRHQEIDFVREALTASSPERVPLVMISGRGGVGKTALSVDIAHKLRHEFPDGQLYANLRGADQLDAVDPFEVLGRFLRALGVDGLALPATLDERMDLYRDLLSGRHVLVLLDNAAGDDQVIPLIPGSPTCAVIINARARLGATLGAETLHLDVLDEDHAASLISLIVGSTRVDTAPEACAELARCCGYLPLALRVVGAKLAAKPHWSIRKLLSLLQQERLHLDHFSHGHLDVRASFALSYAGLHQDAKRLLHQLGDLDLTDVSVWTSAALLDAGLPAAEDTLELLVDAQLIDVVGKDQVGHPLYRLHDLVLLFAKELAHSLDGKEDLVVARKRAMAFHLGIADAAYAALHGANSQKIQGTSPRWFAEDAPIASLVKQPLAWFSTERQTLETLVRRAARDGDSSFCWEIVFMLSPFLQMLRCFDELQGLLEVAHDAALHVGDGRGHAAVLYRMAGNRADHGLHDAAWELADMAAEIFHSLGDQHGYATSSVLLASVDRFRGNVEAALKRYEEALAMLREASDEGAAALVLRCIGQIHLDQGAQADASRCFEQALEISQEIGSQQAEAQVLFWRSMLQSRLGLYVDAETGLRRALRICRALGDLPGEAQCLRGIGLCLRDQGKTHEARKILSDALQVVIQPRPTLLEGFIRQAIAQL